MFFKKEIILFFLTIIIFAICIIFLSKLSIKENFNKDEELNLKTVENFENKKIKFITINEPQDEITKYQTFYKPDIFPELKTINYEIIKNELLNYINNNNSSWIEWPEYELWKNKKNVSSNWTVIPLVCFKKFSKKNIFPETIKELKKIKGLVSAGFSKLGPNTTLKLHKGWGELSNNVLRCHLGLIVPINKCKIYVLGNNNNQMIQEEGKWIVFDDSLYHSASNDDNNNDRIILLLDIKRPKYIEKGVSDCKTSNELKNFVSLFNENL